LQRIRPYEWLRHRREQPRFISRKFRIAKSIQFIQAVVIDAATRQLAVTLNIQKCSLHSRIANTAMRVQVIERRKMIKVTAKSSWKLRAPRLRVGLHGQNGAARELGSACHGHYLRLSRELFGNHAL